MLFQDLGSRQVIAHFNGGHLSSDGGALLLRQIDLGLGLSRRLARCFLDRRDPRWVEHPLPVMIGQRLVSLALGYEDLNDQTRLRTDPLLATACGQTDPLGQHRREADQKGAALASAATLNRLELGHQQPGGGGAVAARYRRIEPLPAELEAALLELGVRTLPRESRLVVLDFDATDDPLHGRQEGRFFHGYYGDYCYLPLFCFCGDACLWAQLRTADRDASEGTVAALEKIVAALRARLGREVKIVVRADSGFAREEILAWCEAHGVEYVVGLARNGRLVEALEPAFAVLEAELEEEALATRGAGGTWRETEARRRFAALEYRTLESWSRSRRVIGKAERTGGERNPRFIVTSVGEAGLCDEGGLRLLEGGAAALYEETYCARGQAENVLKQMKLDLHSGRTSTAAMASNQLRLWWSALAYLMLERLRALGLRGTGLERATLGSVRLRLLKVAAVVTVSVRRVVVRLSGAYAQAGNYWKCWAALRAWAASGG